MTRTALRILAIPFVFLCSLCVECRAQTASAVHTVEEGPDWSRIENEPDIEAGSALDFSPVVLRDAPAGRYGRLLPRNGHAEFEGRPGVPARFYGVNLCDTALCLPDDEIERLTDRLVRLGYNAVRIHHHDDAWAKAFAARKAAGAAGTEPSAFAGDAVDRLDALMAACIRKGIYLTTDLFVSRSVAWRDLGVDRDGVADNMQHVKLLMMTKEDAFRNWCAFARDFLTHENPYTGRCLAEEPAMPMLVLVNEVYSGVPGLNAIPEFRPLWREWIEETHAAVPGAYPAADPNAFPEEGGWWNPSPRSDALSAFWAWCIERFSRRASAFLRDELGVKALVATENNGPVLPNILRMRARAGGFVDIHFYNEHANPPPPEAKEETGLDLDNVFRNNNVLTDYRRDHRSVAFNRVWGRPFTITERNMGGPNFNRAMAGLLTGAYAAIQDWTALFTFAYAHSRGKLFEGTENPPGRWDLVIDPLMQATDRLPILLFLRGDQATPRPAFANAFSKEAMDPVMPKWLGIAPKWNNRGLEWRARLGCSFDELGPLPEGVKRIEAWPSGEPPEGEIPSCGVSVDEEKGNLVVTGPCTCGGFVGDGESFEAGPLAATVAGHRALVAAASVDGDDLVRSPRILLWHLTDLHGHGFQWGGKVTKGVVDEHVGIISWGEWGHPVLVLHSGEVDVSLSLENPEEYHVWALDTSGRRRAEVPCRTEGDRLRFTASSRQSFGGCMYYEIACERKPVAEAGPE